MLEKLRASISRFKKEHEGLWQLFLFWLLGGVAMVVDLAVFALGNYWIFTQFRNVDFSWWLLDYSIANGGLCAFLSLATSFAVSQAVNFVIQRKATFGATNNVLFSAVAYAVMIVLVYFLILWVPTFYLARLYQWLGEGAGAFVNKLLMQILSMLIQFPINKWVIMRKSAPQKKASRV